MPNYIVSGTKVPNCCEEKTDYCKDSARFLNKLAIKLLDMAEAINTKIEKIKEECVNTSGQRGIIMAQIDVKPVELTIKYEYIEYIKRYGPPIKGIFEEQKLEQIRTDLGILT